MAPATRPAPYFTGGFARISQAALRGRFTAVAKHQGGLTALFFTHRKHTITMFPFPTTENLILWACSAIALFAVVFFRRSVRNRRHKRKQQSARRVLERIKTLPGFPQKINYLRKIDPFVFEELLLEGFEAHGFRTIRNKRYTGDGGIDG